MTRNPLTLAAKTLDPPTFVSSAADLIITMFEGAMKAKPNHEDVLSHLFMSYVRTSDYKKQKDIALQLYKIKEHTPFYLWAVMSIVMQVRRAADPRR